jgi:Uma2 family endonuclease
LVEVLSPSTALVDRREKLIAYQSIASLRGYLMVYRDEHRVEAYTRNGEDVWVYQNLSAENEVWFPCVDLTVPVMALYEDVDMSPIVPTADEPDIR